MSLPQPIASVPVERPRPRPPEPQRLRQKAPSYRAVCLEIALKLVVNGALIWIAIATLAELIPYQLAQQSKLREIRSEVENTERRVDIWRDRFSRSFDPLQAESIIQEQTNLSHPNRRPIVWVEPDASSQ